MSQDSSRDEHLGVYGGSVDGSSQLAIFGSTGPKHGRLWRW